MLEPDVTLTDYALVVECGLFALILFSRVRSGAGARATAFFAALFAALSAASGLGGSYHGFFSEHQSAVGDALWLGTLLSIGAVSFFNWLAAAEIQLAAPGRRIVFWIAAIQFIGFAIYVVAISRDFLVASISTAPAMIFLLLGYIRTLRKGSGGVVWLGLFGLLLAFAGAVQQQMQIGIHPDYFSHNAVYHLIQFIAFALIFMSVPGLERSRTGS